MTETVPTEAAERSPAGSLSPSRASDFTACPLKYRLRVIDKVPEPLDPVAVRGTLVHAVLEKLFDAAAPERTLETARGLLPGSWSELADEDERCGSLFDADAEREAAWLAECEELLERYFRMEDPQWVEPTERELKVEHVLDGGLRLRGIVDRLDVAPDGRIRVVDYKTGKAPNERYADKAMFQMRFYALVVWRTRGVMPSLLQLMYLGDGTFLHYVPEESDLLATERRVKALWSAIETATATGEFRPNKGPLCGWCSFQALCPAWGGTPPPYPGHQLPAATAS
jgi:putative RecB family exonuclease